MKTEIIPVIHMLNKKQVFYNVETCISCGIKKVFIIKHKVGVLDLRQCALEVKDKYNIWVGMNLLDMPAKLAISLVHSHIDGIWCDETIERGWERKYKGMLFGGVAFKYQPQPSNLKQVCEEATLLTDVATTSGAGTGLAANLDKIKLMRSYLGDHPMAIASGVSIENISDYNGLVDYALVATSITDIDEMIIKEELSQLISKIK